MIVTSFAHFKTRNKDARELWVGSRTYLRPVPGPQPQLSVDATADGNEYIQWVEPCSIHKRSVSHGGENVCTLA